MYKSCILPILAYGWQIYGKCSKTHLKRLQVIQNKMVKIIYNLDMRYSTEGLHAQYNHKKVHEIIKDLTCSYNES